MALQFSTTFRNELLNQLERTVGLSAKLMLYTGAAPANCAAAASGTKLAEFDLAADWASDASGGSKALSSTPVSVAAVGTGTAGYYRIYASDGTTCHLQGTITLTGLGGDLTADNTSIATAQQVQITGFTLTAPGA